MTSLPERDPQRLPVPLEQTGWHPDQGMLAEFAKGQGSDEAFQRIESHLAECDACVETIESFVSGPPATRVSSTNSAMQKPGAIQERELPCRSIGPYQLTKVLGQGGMGIVYQAEQHVPIRRTVAIKILKPGLTSYRFVRRFESERQTLAILEHPGIAKLLDAGTTDQRQLYFVMEFIRGVPIVEYCNNQRSTIRSRLELLEQVCEAVQHAHQKTIIHRDLKPSNIVVAEVDGTPQPKVIDFGIAKTVDPSPQQTLLTEVGEIVGTLEYLSPEQLFLDPSSVDTRTDVYQLGAVLYELLTNQPPLGFHDRARCSIEQIARDIREREPVPPSSCLARSRTIDELARARSSSRARLVKQVRGELDWIVAKSLEKEPSRRYQAPSELADDIRRYRNNQPLSIPAPSLAYRVRKTVSRHKLAVGFAAIFAAFTLSLMVLTAWLITALNDAEASKRQLRIENAIANIRNAAHYYEQNNLDAAIRLLTALKPESGEDDLRGFEWYYLWNQCHPQRLLMTINRESPMHDIEYSPDGSMYAVTAVRGKTAVLFDATTHEEIFSLDQSSAGSALDFTTNSRHLIVVTYDGWLFVVDTATLELRHEEKLAKQGLNDIAICPNGRYFTVSGGYLWVRDTESFGSRFPPIESESSFDALSYSPDGSWLVAGKAPNRNQKQLCQLVIYECDAWKLKFLDSEIAAPPADFGIRVRSLTVMRDNQTIVGAFSHGAVLTWKIIGEKASNDVRLAERPDKVVFHGNGSGLWAIKLSPDQQYLAVAKDDNTIQVWELAPKGQSYFDRTNAPFAELKGHSNPARGIEFLPDGKTLASVGYDGRINFWNPERNRNRLRFGPNAPTALDYRDGKLLIGLRPEIICWNVFDGEVHSRTPSTGKMSYWAEYFVDGNLERAVALDGQGLVRVFDPETEVTLRQFQLPVNSRLAVHHSKQEFVVAKDQRLQRIGFDGGFIATIGSHDDRINRIDIAESGKIVTCSVDGVVKIWNEEYEYLNTYETGIWPLAIAYSDHNRCIAVSGGGVNSIIQIIDTTTGQRHFLSGHTAEIQCLDYSSDGTRLASGGNDDVVILWDTRTWKDVCTFDQFGNNINSLKFSLDDQLLVVGSANHCVWLLKAPRQ